jgi:hypothetical protein
LMRALRNAFWIAYMTTADHGGTRRQGLCNPCVNRAGKSWDRQGSRQPRIAPLED